MSDERSLWAFIAAWELFADAALAGAAAGALLGMLGVWVVLCRQVFLCAALGQVAALGVAVAFLGRPYLPPAMSPLYGAGAAVLAAGRLLGGPGRRRLGQEARLGLVYLGASAAVLCIGSRMAQEMHDIQTLLFGSAVAVSPAAARLLWALSAALGVLHALMWRGIAQEVVDPDGAQVRGLPVRLLRLCRSLTVGLAIAVVTGVLGALPAFAFSVLPALAALAWAPSLGPALLLAALLGAVAGLGGYVLAFVASLPVGAAQTVVAVGMVLLAHLPRAERGNA